MFYGPSGIFEKASKNCRTVFLPISLQLGIMTPRGEKNTFENIPCLYSPTMLKNNLCLFLKDLSI